MSAPTQTLTPLQATWVRAHERAIAEKLVAFNNGDGTYSVKTYTVSPIGNSWSDWDCTCQAGSVGRVCKHAACVVGAHRAERHAVKAATLLTAEPAATAHCIRCQSAYAYSEASITTRLFCPSCR